MHDYKEKDSFKEPGFINNTLIMSNKIDNLLKITSGKTILMFIKLQIVLQLIKH